MPPNIGASTGASAITDEMIDISRAAWRPEYRSRTTARDSTTPPAPPKACRTRAPISISTDVDMAHSTVAIRKMPIDSSSTDLRPCRSENGP